MTTRISMLRVRTAWALLVLFVSSILAPSTALALTAGPTQPEFQSFTPVATTNMVHPFTGEFQYNLPVLNVPGADGGGYALSLAYNGSPALHQEASWVGQGWTLNPGALNRLKKGLPDDYKGAVKEHNRIKPNWTFTRTIGNSLSVGFGTEFDNLNGSVGASVNTTHSFSNVRGYSENVYTGINGGASVGEAISGTLGAGLGLNFSGREATFSANLSISLSLEAKSKFHQKQTEASTQKKLSPVQLKGSTSISAGFHSSVLAQGSIGNSVASMVKPAAVLSKTFGMSPRAFIGPATYTFSRSQNLRLDVAQPEINYEAYGFMYNPSFNTHRIKATNGEPILSDYGIEKNSVYSPRDKVIGIPYNNADYFNAVGEGIGGSYRLHHHKVGHYYSDLTAAIISKEHTVIPNVSPGGGVKGEADKKGVAVGFDATIQLVNKGSTWARTWESPDNQGRSTRMQSFEFEDTYNDDPEQTENLPFFRATGDLGGALLYSDLDAEYENNPVFPDPEDLSGLVKDFRGGFMGKIRKAGTDYDGQNPNVKRPNISKYIAPERCTQDDYYKGQASYMEYVRNKDLYDAVNNQLDASDAFEKNSRTLRFLSPNNSTGLSNKSIAKTELGEHIAQVRIWNPDGNRYTYGLPVYVRDDANFSYGVSRSRKILQDSQTYWGTGVEHRLINESTFYPDATHENQLEIKLGQELEEWYANNYLMTQITTPDYVDVTDDGPSADDFGGYTSFDYRRWTRSTDASAAESTQWYRYRTPYTGLDYQENELAKQSDDMGTVVSGMRENYYLNAIETKSHIAIFITNKTVASEDFAFAFDNAGALQQAEYDGSGEERYDGLGQLAETPADLVDPLDENIPVVAGDTSALNNPNAKAASQQLEKLERIVLFAKNDLSKPLVTTHFDYDYSSWKNVTNNKYARYGGNPTELAKSGKLTLKKVWFEYQGVKNYRVSPYEFEYSYKKLTGADRFDPVIQARYPYLFDPTTGEWPQYEDAAEHPQFNPDAADRWGNWAYNGLKRNKQRLHWLYQGTYEDPYDPAAWMLKQIKLPSGGEIHIQYEEKTYQTVQDNGALAMVSLKANGSTDDTVDDKNKYYLDLEDLGFDNTNTAKVDQLVEAIKDQFMDKYEPFYNGTAGDYSYTLGTDASITNRMYIKFKYNLQNNNNNAAEFISGYAQVKKVGVDNNGVYISLGNIKERNVLGNRKGIPRELCYDYITGMNHENFSYDYQETSYPMLEVDSVTGSAMDSYQDFLNRVRTGGSVGTDLGFKEQFEDMDSAAIARSYPTYRSACKQLHLEDSYLRVPMITPKRGGGVRVKRVLMYDAGMHNEQGDAQLFGTEYHYINEDGSCSGVASNEPIEGREENAIVRYEPREAQSGLSKVFAGRDRKEGEWPYGEFMLPSPSVHYGRVVMSNLNIKDTVGEIKTKQQAGGFTVQQYYTAADYPTKMYFDKSKADYGILNETPDEQNVDQTYLWGDKRNGARHNYSRKSILGTIGTIAYNKDKRWLAQGFLFIQTNMVGQAKEEATYGGSYDPLYFSDHQAYLAQLNGSADISLTSKMEYEYYQPGQRVKTLAYDTGTNSYNIKERHLGLTDDVTIAQQAVYEEATSSNLNLGLTVTFYGGVDIAPSVGFNFSLSEKAMSRHMTTRVLYFPAVIKSVKTTMNRAESKVEHLAFSELTGSPIISRTTDGYDRSVVAEYSTGVANAINHKGDLYNWNLPAAWYYPEMGQRALGADNTNQLTATVGSVTSYGDKGNPLLDGDVDAWVDDANTQKNVLAASAMTLKNGDWFGYNNNNAVLEEYSATTLPITKLNELNKTYRIYKNYVFNPTTGASSANGGNNRTHSSGIMDNFSFFSWLTNATNTDWKVVSEVTLYSPNGYALEEQDLLADIPSAAKYGYQKFLSTAIAKNASYNTIGFESFEDERFAQNAALTADGHAGRYSLTVGTTPETVLSNLEVNNRIKDAELGNYVASVGKKRIGKPPPCV